MGVFESELDGRTVHLLDQVEASALQALRELVLIQKELGADTSGIYISELLQSAPAAQSVKIVLPLSNMLGVAVNALVKLGWGDCNTESAID